MIVSLLVELGNKDRSQASDLLDVVVSAAPSTVDVITGYVVLGPLTTLPNNVI
jgi:hypothetical protein